MSTDLRTTLLARCDELEKLARAADDPDDWRARRAVGALALATPDDEMDREWWVAGHIATWHPAAVLELVAGAREMCEEHYRVYDNIDDANAFDCICGRGDDCPTLRSTARMLGVAVTS